MRWTIPWIWVLLMVIVAGCGAPSFLVKPVTNLNDLEEQKVQDGKGLFPPKILIIPVEGMISNRQDAGVLSAGENPVSLLAQQLRKARMDPSVKAVVLRINSPGGTVTASDTIYRLIRDFKAETKVPVIASTQEVAASGAYYIALSADRIVAHPTSIVGSIGVVFTTFDVEGTLRKIGARTYTIKSGEFKDIASPLKPLTDPERQLIQQMVDEYFQRFARLVQDRRPIEADRLGIITDGRVFSGDQALQLHLVDELGTLEDALDMARKLGEAPNAKAVLYIRPYGYGGSIYASAQQPAAHTTDALNVNIPALDQALPLGFYYLWKPLQ